jgi:hypothetical protein
LPCNEATALKRLHHLTNARRGNKEMPLDVRFSWRPTKASDVLREKREVLELPFGGLLINAIRRRYLRRTIERRNQSSGISLDP